MSDEPLVSVEGLVVRYGGLSAVDEVSFTIPRGAIFGFIGPNGAGKTSTIRVMATLQRPTAGTVTIGGHCVVGATAQVRRQIGFMPDAFGVYEDLTAEQYLQFFAAAYGLAGKARERTIGDALELTDLADKRGAQIAGLSRGMKQRLNLARVLLHDPQLLLLDEPASGLGPRARVELRELLLALKGLGKTILISSHILSELAQLVSELAIMQDGKLVASGSVEAILGPLQAHVGVELELANDGEALRQAIAGLALVASLEPDESGRLLLHPQPGVAAEALLPELLATGAQVRCFRPRPVDLEQAFIALTEGGA